MPLDSNCLYLQTKSTPNAVGTNTEQLLSKAIPTLEVQTVYKELLYKSTPTLGVQTVAF